MTIKDDVIVRVVDMPHRVKGVVSESPDGAFNVYLNARHNAEMQREALTHEVEHIKNGDLSSGKSVTEIEG